MWYGIYKDIRNGAWLCLQENGIDSFPVDVLKIARTVKISVKKNSDTNALLPGEYGKLCYNGKKWFIIYDETQPTVVSRYTVAHELGHFFLGHDLTHTEFEKYQTVGKKPKAETQADAFAIRILAPACVLNALDIESAEDIAKVCGIPLPQAKKRSERMKELRKRGKFFTNPIEREVFKQFEPYIKMALKKEKRSLKS